MEDCIHYYRTPSAEIKFNLDSKVVEVRNKSNETLAIFNNVDNITDFLEILNTCK